MLKVSLPVASSSSTAPGPKESVRARLIRTSSAVARPSSPTDAPELAARDQPPRGEHGCN
eukprot:CAMPEP_0119420040 /NCGR_PEP_ID=MMETSP1335-20130426/22479_1 /TAXON_ID=259385 /ORGANISM="Chrysoculter rhomboideus, Strain RCC1486" /LENGTH=59 /DNA_ID=CAMNT_0007445379 /DNA_START=552 /DNA_END=728 /DNA_ORIENTATION=+